MSKPNFSAYAVSRVTPLRDTDYFSYLSHEVLTATRRVWIASFIVNPTVEDDQSLSVRQLLKSLAYAAWKHVDVRLLIGTSSVKSIRVSNHVARSYARSLGVPTRVFESTNTAQSLHSKYSIIDRDQIIAGSHNLTPGAAERHTEDSISLRSTDLAALLSEEFEHHWAQAKKNDQ